MWPSAPIAVSNLRGVAVIEPHADAAFYFAQGPQYRITAIPDVLIVRTLSSTVENAPPANGPVFTPSSAFADRRPLARSLPLSR